MSERERIAGVVCEAIFEHRDNPTFCAADIAERAADTILSPRGEQTEAVAWFKMAERQPEPGCKFVALFDDGSGAWLGFAHDGGVIDSDGDDYSNMPNAVWWAYLPSGFRLCCEDHPAEALTLPEHVCPPLAHPAGAEAPSVVGALEAGACPIPPAGWYCTRQPGHEGPCAAWPREASTREPVGLREGLGAIMDLSDPHKRIEGPRLNLDKVWDLAHDLLAALSPQALGEAHGSSPDGDTHRVAETPVVDALDNWIVSGLRDADRRLSVLSEANACTQEDVDAGRVNAYQVGFQNGVKSTLTDAVHVIRRAAAPSTAGDE